MNAETEPTAFEQSFFAKIGGAKEPDNLNAAAFELFRLANPERFSFTLFSRTPEQTERAYQSFLAGESCDNAGQFIFDFTSEDKPYAISLQQLLGCRATQTADGILLAFSAYSLIDDATRTFEANLNELVRTLDMNLLRRYAQTFN